MIKENKEFNDLKWKIFWKNKFKEVFKFIIIFLGFTIFPYLVGRFMGNEEQINSFLLAPLLVKLFIYWLFGCLVILMSCLVVLLIVLIIKGFKEWIESNMGRAEEEALEIINKQRGGKKR